MANVVEIARKRLAEIEAEANVLRTFLSAYAAVKGGKAVDDGPYSGAATLLLDEATASPAEIIAGAKQLMKDRGGPLSRSRIVKLLMEQGFNLPGQDKAKNVGTVIWRSKQFDNIAGFGYWPKEFGRWIGQQRPDIDD